MSSLLMSDRSMHVVEADRMVVSEGVRSRPGHGLRLAVGLPRVDDTHILTDAGFLNISGAKGADSMFAGSGSTVHIAAGEGGNGPLVEGAQGGAGGNVILSAGPGGAPAMGRAGNVWLQVRQMPGGFIGLNGPVMKYRSPVGYSGSEINIQVEAMLGGLIVATPSVPPKSDAQDPDPPAVAVLPDATALAAVFDLSNQANIPNMLDNMFIDFTVINTSPAAVLRFQAGANSYLVGHADVPPHTSATFGAQLAAGEGVSCGYFRLH